MGGKIGLGCGGCLGVLLVLFLFAGCVAALSGGGEAGSTGERPSETAGAPRETPEEEEAAPAEEAPEEEEEGPATIGNGVHRVGEDIGPGTYTTDGPDPDDLFPMCYYARLSGLSGELDDIIANNNIEGPGSVVVEEGDTALELSGGCEWTLQEP
ncbi:MULTISPECIES: hypothetical protein [unclassified Nocardiopsis]|uniref:hypothetical protein n=1 Tax=unclassified Nocardiopsis TaxID=2649073 RepID=UPI00135C569B|nr:MULTISPECIES: hypothetical protein [unclassified Nocardiopsis]